MLDWLSSLGRKADHPMYNVEEAGRLLRELSKDAAKALEEIASWLESVTAATGFAPADRAGVVKLLDDSGAQRERVVLSDFLVRAELKDEQRVKLWRVALGFREKLAAAYELALQETKPGARAGSAARAERLALLARALRTQAATAKLLYLRYLAPGPQLWRSLAALYGAAEAERLEAESLKVCPADPLPSSPRLELLRALLLDAAAPEAAGLAEIEIASRAIARLASGFVFSAKPETGCDFVFDLAAPRRPARAAGIAPAPTLRYFGPGRAAAAIGDIIERHTAHPDEPENRFGEEFPIEEKLLALKRLLRRWSAEEPGRRGPRVALNAPIRVSAGLKAATELVTRIEFAGMAEVTTQLRMKIREQTGIALEAEEKTAAVHEWIERDASAWGIGVEVPRADESWARIGTLVTFQPAGLKSWWVGTIRRLRRDEKGSLHAGIEVLAKKPVSVYLRGLGQGAECADNWQTSSGSFDFTFAAAVILGESAVAGERAEILIERGLFAAGVLYELMVGEKSPHVRLDELLERGEDYDRVRIAWLRP